MSLAPSSARPLACLKQALRQCRAERHQLRQYATAESHYPSLQTRYPAPSPGFRTSHATKQNRPEVNMKKIAVVPPPRSIKKVCPDPIEALYQSQLKTLDPTGARTRLFAKTNVDRAQVGDILLVRLKSGDPFSGVCINIRRRHSPIDTAVLLRNQLTRVGVEMWFKIYSPNVEGIEVVQRKQGRRARRAKLYYMRKPSHDMGSVEGVTAQYIRQRAGGTTRGKAGGQKKKSKSKK
ncbi:54s ribosomal protein subunit img1, mitochondrial [Acrodontium crateriforme]|uniref:54s ribosomal protein subunit img1, mitochondrial n=1 Tax=Acrodontium crateriforme TaxID=150365 RepID=A0AAQ3LYI2_9PEZI|nr:54s ribosomal protein subunit img1, mitochondrial [Acrodontium crateriforme]